ncbi:alpha/beta hydrolase [Sporosarcina cascadiensis]|uniref:alpha/beta hydrolase n=1 Tax=Sporosarcina cascadiensis TaxID=2660747 RepID=UPI0018915D21|nr:alpha/beta hydrolase [Sporosarcina cascadiensis]
MHKLLTVKSGEYNLSGALHLPEFTREKVPLLIFIHGFVGSKVGEHRLFVKAARYFTKRGFAVFRFDFSGCGESEGDYGGVTLTNQLNEVQDVIDYVSRIRGINAHRITLVGHSLGGAVASLTAAADPRVKDLILWSPVGLPYEDITGILGRQAVNEISRNGSYDYQGFSISRRFLKDLQKHRPFDTIGVYRGGAHIIHAEADEQIPKAHAASYRAVLNERINTEPVTERYIENADHTFSDCSLENELFDKSYEWLKRKHMEQAAVRL